jgi:hypothetical protein
MAKSPAWQRAEGKNPKGGLNAKGRASYNAANPGKPGLKAPQPKGGSRRDSFCARMKGMKAKLTSAKTAQAIRIRGLTRAFVRGTAQMAGTSAKLMVVPPKAKREVGLCKWTKYLSSA